MHWCARQGRARRYASASPVHVAPHKAQQGAQEDRVSPQVAAVQVCDGLEGVDAAHLQARTLGGEVVLQLSRTEEGRVKHGDVPQQPCEKLTTLLPKYFSCTPALWFRSALLYSRALPETLGARRCTDALPDSPPGLPGKLRQRPAVSQCADRLAARLPGFEFGK